MNTKTFGSLDILHISPFDTYMELEDYILDTLEYDQQYRSLDRYGGLREPLGQHQIGISYDLFSKYESKADDFQYDMQLYLHKLCCVYTCESQLSKCYLNIDGILIIYLNDYFTIQMHSIWEIMKFQKHALLGQAIRCSLHKAKHYIATKQHSKNKIFQQTAISHL